MRERRRLELVRRQLLLTGIARREVMGALAGAIDEEARSAALVERSRLLADEYRAASGSCKGHELQDRARFSGALTGLAVEADRSRVNAGHQAAGRQRTLAAIENKMKRLDAHEQSARQQLGAMIERRSAEDEVQLARKLLKKPATNHPDEEAKPQ